MDRRKCKIIPVFNFGWSLGEGIYEIAYGDEYYFEHNEEGYDQWKSELFWSTFSTELTLGTLVAGGLNGSETSILDASIKVKLRLDSIATGVSNFFKKGTSNIPKATDLELSQTVENHLTDIIKKGELKGELARPFTDSKLLIQEIMDSGTPVKDAILSNGLKWEVPGTFRGSDTVPILLIFVVI